MKLFQFFRIFTGAGIITSVYSHQVHFVLPFLGISFITISYLFCLLSFYVYIFLKYFVPGIIQVHEDGSLEKTAHRIRIGILLLNIILCIIENVLLADHLDIHKLLQSMCMNILLVGPDIILDFFIRLFRSGKDKDA